MRAFPRWPCRCGLRFTLRKELREHVFAVHRGSGKQKLGWSKTGSGGKRRVITPKPPTDDRF